MQRNALMAVALLASALHSTTTAQIISAQPARGFNAAPTYSAAYPPAGAYSPGLASTVNSPEANTVRGWYRDYLGRDVGQDLGALVNLLRGGMSPTDLQATILGSDEFYSQKGRDPQAFVRETLQSVTWTEPSYADIQRWTDRLNQLRGDRFALAREILLSGTQPQSQAAQLTEPITRLSSAARLVVQTIDLEIGGTPQGRQANLQAQSLVDAANQLQTAALATSRITDLQLPLSSAERAYQALQQTLSNPPGTAPSASGVVRRIGTMLTDVRIAAGGGLAVGGTGYPPLGGTSPLPSNLPSSGYGSQPLLEQVSAARRATESLIQTLTSQSYQDYSYNIVLRDLDTLASRLAALEPLVRSGISRDRIGYEVQGIADSAERIRQQLNTSRLPYTARLYWQSLDSSLALLRETAGVGAIGSIGAIADSPTVLRPTSLHESLLPLLDQAASQIDVFLAGTAPLVYSVPDLPGVQADARSLRSRVLLLRQQAGAGQPSSVLKQTLNSMIGDYQDGFDRWNRIVATTRLYNPAKLSPIGETLNRVEQLINQALASGDLSPSGPTRVSQDLVLLSGEVNDARRSLNSLRGYREQQSIDLYLEQIAGYVQQIGDVLARPTTVDARRLAVGMQGVVGRMQSDVNNLNQAFSGPLTPTLRQQVSDLQYRVARIGRLVDEVETQLY